MRQIRICDLSTHWLLDIENPVWGEFDFFCGRSQRITIFKPLYFECGRIFWEEDFHTKMPSKLVQSDPNALKRSQSREHISTWLIKYEGQRTTLSWDRARKVTFQNKFHSEIPLWWKQPLRSRWRWVLRSRNLEFIYFYLNSETKFVVQIFFAIKLEYESFRKN